MVMNDKREKWVAEYITAGGTHGAHECDRYGTAKAAFESFKRQGATVRLIHVIGDKAEVLEVTNNG